jgi:hypothetical protein
MTFTAAVAVAALVCGAPEPKAVPVELDAKAEFAKGQQLFGQFKYAEAIKTLVRVRTQRLDRATLLATLELLGVSYGQQRQPEKAEEAFRVLLTLDPQYALKSDYAPRVMTPFFTAKQAAADAGELSARPGSPVVRDGRVEALVISVERDALALVKTARFHVERKPTQELPVTAGLARVTVDPAVERVSWWVELVGANGEQLTSFGSEAAPLNFEVPKVEPVKVSLPAQPVAPAPTVVASTTTPALTPLRTGALVSLGVGVIAAGVGTGFGLGANASFAAVTGATKDPNGVVVGITEVQSRQLLATGRTDATLANVLFAAAGAAVITAVVLWLVGAPAPSLTSWWTGTQDRAIAHGP